MKTCTKCGERKPVTDFFILKSATDGFRPDCKACLSAKQRERYERDRVNIIEQQLEYVRRNSEAVKKAHQRSHRRRSQNPEWLAQKRAKGMEWQKANREKRALSQQRRLARLANAPVNDFTQKQWEAIKAAYRNRCAYCGIDSKRLCMEHVIPLSRGGPHTASNIVPSCNPCNTSKGDRPAPPMLVVPLMLQLGATQHQPVPFVSQPKAAARLPR